MCAHLPNLPNGKRVKENRRGKGKKALSVFHKLFRELDCFERDATQKRTNGEPQRPPIFSGRFLLLNTLIAFDARSNFGRVQDAMTVAALL